MERSKASPFFSIVTVSYNAVDTLPQTVESVAGQFEDDWEHLIVDGASTDGTVEFLKSLNERVTWISEPDNGIYQAMNKGIRKARGEVIAFLNADDAYLPDTLEAVRRVFDSEVDIVYGNIRKERFLAGRWYHRFEKPNLDLMPQTMGIFHPATFVRRSLFEQLGLYDEKYRFSADYEWLLRAYLAEARFKYLDQNLAIFRVGGVSAMNCGSYEEGAAILRRHQTGHADAMEKLVEQCRKNVRKRHLIYTLARLTGTTRLLEKRVTKKWIPNHGGFGS